MISRVSITDQHDGLAEPVDLRALVSSESEPDASRPSRRSPEPARTRWYVGIFRFMGKVLDRWFVLQG